MKTIASQPTDHPPPPPHNYFQTDDGGAYFMVLLWQLFSALGKGQAVVVGHNLIGMRGNYKPMKKCHGKL